MPSAAIKSFADKSGKSIEKVEALWKEAKKGIKKSFPNVTPDSDRFFALVTGLLKKMLGLSEQDILPDINTTTIGPPHQKKFFPLFRRSPKPGKHTKCKCKNGKCKCPEVSLNAFSESLACKIKDLLKNNV